MDVDDLYQKLSHRPGMSIDNYVGPGSPLPTKKRAAVLGEFGGLGLRVEGHMWIPEDAFAYEMKSSRVDLEVSKDCGLCL